MLKAAERAASAHDHTRACCLLNVAALLDPSVRTSAFVRLGTLYLERGDYSLAEWGFQQAIDSDPDAPPGYEGRIRVAIARQDWASALRSYDFLGQKFPRLAGQAYTSMGDILWQRLRIDSVAEQAYRTAMQAEPERTEPIAHLAELYRDCGEWAKAAATYAQLADAPADDRIDALVQAAVCRAKSGRPDESAEELRQLAIAKPDEPRVLMGLASVQEFQKRYEEAVRNYCTAAAISDRYAADAFGRVTLIRLTLGDRGKAASAFDKALAAASRSTDVATALVQLAGKMIAAGEMEFALQAVRCAGDAQPASKGLMWFTAGNLLVRQGQSAEARGCFLEALSSEPENQEYLIALAPVLEALELWEDAAEAYTKLSNFADDDQQTGTMCRLAMALARSSRNAEAEALAEELVQRAPLDASVQRTLADIYELTGDARSEIEMLWRVAAGIEKGVAESVRTADAARQEHARVMTRVSERSTTVLQDPALAERALVAALKVDPLSRDLLLALARNQEQRENWEGAANTYRRLSGVPEADVVAWHARALYCEAVAGHSESAAALQQLAGTHTENQAVRSAWACYSQRSNSLDEDVE